MTSKTGLSDSMIRMLPKAILLGDVRSRLEMLFSELDQLLFLDDTLELAVDRETLMRIASNEDLLPASHRDIALLETSKHLGRRVKGLGKGRRISWRDGSKYGLPIQPPSRAQLDALGITKTASIDDLRIALKKVFPELPKFWIKTNAAQLAETVLRSFLINRTVWDCLVANLGFWAALVIIGSLVIFFILLASLPWPVALAVAIVCSGVATAYVVLQCIANQNFHQF